MDINRHIKRGKRKKNVAIKTKKISNDQQYSNTNHLNENREIRTKVWPGFVCYSNLKRSEEIIFLLCPKIPTLSQGK